MSSQSVDSAPTNPISEERPDSAPQGADNKETTATPISVPPTTEAAAEPVVETATEAAPAATQPSNDVEDVEMGDGEDEVFQVEKILNHKKEKSGGYTYLIKWQGFSEEDNTWEAEDNIEELIKAYWAKQSKKESGKQPPAKKKKTAESANASAHTITAHEKLLDHNWPPKDLTDWESDVVEVETIQPDKKAGGYKVYLVWKNGHHTCHSSKEANVKCPQKIIAFYENHLKFSD